jgi:hypothetical protein
LKVQIKDGRHTEGTHGLEDMKAAVIPKSTLSKKADKPFRGCAPKVCGTVFAVCLRSVVSEE